MLHLRSGATAEPAPISWNFVRFLASEQGSSWDQALWIGIVIGLCLGFVAAVSTEWVVDQFLPKDAVKSRSPRSAARGADDRSRQAGTAAAARPTRAHDLHAWLADCSENEAREFFSVCAQGPRGHLLEAALLGVERVQTTKTLGPQPEHVQRNLGERLLSDELRTEELEHQPSTASARSDQAQAGAPIVQFAQFMSYVVETEARASLEVIRFGNLSEATQVRYHTVDASAVAGTSYAETKGTLVFAPGEHAKFIQVPLIDNEHWDVGLEFKVCLDLDDAVNCFLEQSMWHARVKIIDTTAFPSDRYAEELRAGRFDNIPKFGLLYEYIMFNLTNPPVKMGTIKMILIEQGHNMNFFLRLCMSVFLIDVVLSPNNGGGRQLDTREEKLWALAVVALLNLIPMAALHYGDFTVLGYGVGGQSKKTLQRALVGKFLTYGVESRTLLRPGSVSMAITQDAEDLVEDGYMPVIDLSKNVGDIITMLVFQFSVPWLFGRSLNTGVLFALFLLPLGELMIFFRRKEYTTAHLEEKHEKLEALTKGAVEAVEEQKMIASYSREPHTMDKFVDLVVAKNACDRGTAQLLLNNNYIGTWLLTVLVSGYFFFGGLAVLQGTQPLGMFLANISVFQTIGACCNKITNLLGKMETATPALERIAMLLNLPDDMARRQQLQQKASADTHKLLDGLTQITLNDLPIRVADVQYKYTRPGCPSLWPPVNLRGVMQIQQGTMVSLVGKRRQGKSTLLKLLGGELLLQDEVIAGPRAQVFIPPHVRVIHVQGEPMFFDGTLYENLTYGVSHHKSPGEEDATGHRRGSRSDGDMARVVRICQMLGLSEDVLSYVQTQEVNCWKAVLSSTDSYILSLARAFIANPQVLCVHKPTQIFDELSSRRILELLQRFVRERGLLQDSAFSERRPRTVIFTSSKLAGVEISDQVFHVSSQNGVQAVSKEHVTAEMLL